jgi:hypothetical protein
MKEIAMTTNLINRYSTSALILLGLAAATGCATETPPTLDETRGPLRLAGYMVGRDAVIDVTGLDGAPIATVTCDARARVVSVASPLDPTSVGQIELPAEARGCDLAFTAEVAAQAGRGLIRELTPSVAFDNAGCDGIGGDSICCARHDACYAANDCSAWSWLYSGLATYGFSACSRCNVNVVACLAWEAI